MKNYTSKFIVLVFVLCVSIFGKLSAQTNSSKLITCKYEHLSLTEIMDSVEKRTSYHFFYRKEWFSDIKTDISVENNTIQGFMNCLLRNIPYTYEIVHQKNVILIPKEKYISIMGYISNNITSQKPSDLLVVGKVNDFVKNKKVKITGTIKSNLTNTTIPGALIRFSETKYITATSNDGSFSLEVTPGIYSLSVTCLGYEELSKQIKVLSSGNVELSLTDETKKINEVNVYGQRDDHNISDNQMSTIQMNSKFIKNIPSLLGTKDIIKVATLMPGIKNIGEFGTDISVRGGGTDQNLYLLNGCPIFNTAHILGILSAINTDVVSNTTIYKGDIPVKYGERVSSIVDIELKPGNFQTTKGIGGIGIIDSHATIEGPVIKNKLSFVVGGRTTYSDWLLKKLHDINLQNSAARFFDLNVVLNWKMTKNNSLIMSYYYSQDYFDYNNNFSYKYGNSVGSLAWNHIFKNGILSKLSFNSSNYFSTKEDKAITFQETKMTSKVDYKSLRQDFLINIKNKHLIQFGVQGIYYQINPGEITPSDENSYATSQKIKKEQALETAIFASDKIQFSNGISITAGIRYTNYFFLGNNLVYKYNENVTKSNLSIIDSTFYSKGKVIKSYQGLEPRISARFIINGSNSIKFSYSKNNQYINLISYSSISSPDNVWKLSDSYLKPLTCNQFALGFFKNLKQNSIEISVEVYYKTLKHLVDYKNAAKITMNPHIETDVVDADGENYGIEFLIKKNTGKINGWISYTFSKAMKQTTGVFSEDKINNNTQYPSSYNKPHDLACVLTYNYNRRIRYNAVFVYSSGRNITLPEAKYQVYNQQTIYYSERNKYQLPAYHRLDLSVSLDESMYHRKKWKGNWTFTIMNVYGRHNAYSVFYQRSEPKLENQFRYFGLYKLFIIGRPFPTLTYNFIF